MHFSQLNSVFLLFELFNSFTVILLLPIFYFILHIIDFKKYYLSNHIETLSLENRKIALLGDFSVNLVLLKYDSNNDVSYFLDTIHSNLLPHVTSPTRITVLSSTLIDNIFSNFFDYSLISGNIVTAPSDYHAQF